jgi:two-component system, OmpR family, response regulator
MSALTPVQVAVIHRDPGLARLLGEADSGVCAVHVEPTVTVVGTLGQSPCDVLVLEAASLPDPCEFCRSLRTRSSVPLLLLTSHDDASLRIEGLTSGADATATEATSPLELLALLRALVRRARALNGPTLEKFSVGALSIHPESKEAVFEGMRVQLSGYEFALIEVLARHAGQPLTREHLLDLAKGSAEAAYDRSIDVQISRLRHKLGDDPGRPRLIKTVRGVGYVLATHGEARPSD